MPNRPEFLALWLGVTRIGGVVALLNTNLTGLGARPLHQRRQPEAHHRRRRHASARCRRRRHTLTGNAKIWLHGEAGSRFSPPRPARSKTSRATGSPRHERRALTIEDRALFIYTSGTTGLPKAANINHYRLMLASHAFAGVMDTQISDRMYDCLPMYHTAGGVVATGAVLVNGGSVVIREKFSAREFWDDVVRCDCTLVQYIGELCRYLVNSPPHPHGARAPLRLACGNGLRPDVWHEFKERFRIPQIIEFYGATEGNVTLFNFEGKEGSVGRIPWYLANRFPTKIVRFDVERQEPVRDDRRALHRMRRRRAGRGRSARSSAIASKPGQRFEGYAASTETEKKILRDVFEKGDVWFRTGDLMRKDENGYFYFVDRIGDTFRWKGENVSTTEVEEAIGAFDGALEANVYGVAVPGRDGRAGMAAIVAKPGFQSRRVSRASRATAAGLCPAGVPAHPRGHRGDHHLQAEESRPREAGLRSEHVQRSDLFQRSRSQDIRAARRVRSMIAFAAEQVRL